MNEKRTIVSKGDGRNYLGYSPDGNIYNMKKNLEGRFYKYTWKEKSKGACIGDPLPKSKFTLVE